MGRVEIALKTCQLVLRVVLLVSASNSTMHALHCQRFMLRRIGAYVEPMMRSPFRSVEIMKMASPTLPIHHGNGCRPASQSLPPFGCTLANSPTSVRLFLVRLSNL